MNQPTITKRDAENFLKRGAIPYRERCMCETILGLYAELDRREDIQAFNEHRQTVVCGEAE